jgi:hypothetical protein
VKPEIRELRAADVPACERLLSGLPDWFGMEETNREYIGGLLRRPSAVAEVSGQSGARVRAAVRDAGPLGPRERGAHPDQGDSRAMTDLERGDRYMKMAYRADGSS